jgi:signal transduction histidine kinase
MLAKHESVRDGIMSPASFLVVDDHRELAESMCELLMELEPGAECSVAPDGAAALALMHSRAFDVAFIDLHLPDVRGTDVVTQLRAVSPFVQVVIVTGDGTLESAISAVRTSAFAYVLKPVRPEDLIDTAKRALAQARGYREHEQLRLELESSERRHREVVEAMPIFVLALDRSGDIVLWNRRLEEVTGYSRQEMLGEPGFHLVGDGGSDRTLPLKSGGHRLVRWQCTGVPEGYFGNVLYATGIDVTDEREMLRRTVRAERLAAVGTLAAGLAHEVRNPLNSAILQLDLLERRLGKGVVSTPGILDITRIVRDEIRRLDRLVNDFLAFAQPRPLDLQSLPVNQVLQGATSLVAPELQALGIELRTEYNSSAGRVDVDPPRFRQVLINLFRNAIEAMDGRGMLTVRTRGADASGNVLIDIEDTGPGFAEELPIFDAFFTTKEGGTGLGLAIVHRIVSDHGGSIQVSSRPGRTRFTLVLPESTSRPG